MKKVLSYVVTILLALSATGCRDARSTFSTDGLEPIYTPEYADGFALYRAGQNSTILKVTDPWQGADDVNMHLFLSRNGEQPPAGFDGVVVEAPLKKVVCMSTSYIAYLDAVGETDAVCGVSGIRYVTNPRIRSRYYLGEIRDVGYDAYMNYELLANLAPDLVLIYGISGENTQLTGKLRELGIKYIYIGDYVEQNPLGKSEWMVAFGEMFNKRERGQKVFNSIRDRYNETKSLVADYVDFLADITSTGAAKKPVVMLNAPYRDTWYVPGDLSYIVRLITDAGAEYACAGQDNEQSRPISGESAYVLASQADIWLNPGQAFNMDDVKAQNPKFADIPPVLNNKVYNCNARLTPEGGSDFWESGAVRPDIVLRDLVKIVHPELMQTHKLYYFRQMR